MKHDFYSPRRESIEKILCSKKDSKFSFSLKEKTGQFIVNIVVSYKILVFISILYKKKKILLI